MKRRVLIVFIPYFLIALLLALLANVIPESVIKLNLVAISLAIAALGLALVSLLIYTGTDQKLNRIEKKIDSLTDNCHERSIEHSPYFSIGWAVGAILSVITHFSK